MTETKMTDYSDWLDAHDQDGAVENLLKSSGFGYTRKSTLTLLGYGNQEKIRKLLENNKVDDQVIATLFMSIDQAKSCVFLCFWYINCLFRVYLRMV